MGSGAENIYPLPPPVLLPPLGEAAPRTPGAGPGRPRGRGTRRGGDPPPGPGAGRTDLGSCLLPLPSDLGQGGGSTRGQAAPKLGEWGGGKGGGPAAHPGAQPAPRVGRRGACVEPREGRAGARRCPTAAPHRRCPPATGAGEKQSGEELLAPLPGTP